MPTSERTAIILLPGALGNLETEPRFDEGLTHLKLLAEIGEVKQIQVESTEFSKEATWLGIPPKGGMADGPLWVAAMGFDPPDASLQFTLTPCQVDDEGIVRRLAFELLDAELGYVYDLLKKLNTPSLTLLYKPRFGIALVWEGKGDFQTVPLPLALGKSLSQVQPQGDMDWALRRWLDDSVNILREAEFNLRRMDEGLQPFNLLWPSGEGRRYKAPNLALRRGEPARVQTTSMRLAGLARLCGYLPLEMGRIGKGTGLQFEAMYKQLFEARVSLTVLPDFAEFWATEQTEELLWLRLQMDERLFKPLLNDIAVKHLDAHLLITNEHLGLWLDCQSKQDSKLPFNENALERDLKGPAMHEVIDRVLAPTPILG